MNKTLLAIFALLMSLSCSDEMVRPKKGTIQFNHSPNLSGRTAELPTPSKVLVSIQDHNGISVIENKVMDLIGFGNGYITENIQLATGNYNLTQFIILDFSNKAIYATPKEGSELAHLVKDPLPIGFNVSENAITTVTPQVVAIKGDAMPEQFGYISFGFEIISQWAGKLKQVDSYYGTNQTGKSTFYYDSKGNLKYSVTWSMSSVLSPYVIDSTLYHFSADSDTITIETFDFHHKEQPYRKNLTFKNNLLQQYRLTDTYDASNFQFDYTYDSLNRPTRAIQRRLDREGKVIQSDRMFEYEYDVDPSHLSISQYSIDINETKIRKWVTNELIIPPYDSPFLPIDPLLPNNTSIVKWVTTIVYDINNNVTEYCSSWYDHTFNISDQTLTSMEGHNPDSCSPSLMNVDDGKVYKYSYY